MVERVLGASHPQVFVVDSQATLSYAPLPPGRALGRGGISRRVLHLLVGLALFGVAMEAGFIFYLYSRMKHENASIMGQIGAEEINKIPGTARRGHSSELQQKPLAHMKGGRLMSASGVVLWEVNSFYNSFHRMDYKNGTLVVHVKGYYYVYSKVHFSGTPECSSFKHTVMRNTTAYNKPLDLMQSTRHHGCVQRGGKREVGGATSQEDLLNSFLGGVFLLDTGDTIFVRLENRKNMNFFADDFIGAFMI